MEVASSVVHGRSSGSSSLAAASFCAVVLLTVARRLRQPQSAVPTSITHAGGTHSPLHHSPRAALKLLPACSRVLAFAAEGGRDSSRSVLHACYLEVVADTLGAVDTIVAHAATDMQVVVE